MTVTVSMRMSSFLRLRQTTRLTAGIWGANRRHLATIVTNQNDTFTEPSTPEPRRRPNKSLLVNCHNEWDPLEEVIVGTFRDACVPPLEHSLKAAFPRESWAYFEKGGARLYPKEIREKGEADVDGFCRILEAEGVKVRRPEVFPPERGFSKKFNTPDFESPSTMDAGTPRDSMMVIGDTIVEAPMSRRCRFFDYRNYRKLVKEYFKAGAKWLPAPKGMLGDETYNWHYSKETPGRRATDGRNIDYDFCITEFEPLFDTADFIRMGRDIFFQLSNVTNQFGVQWLRSHFPAYRFHRVSFRNNQEACHIDSHFVPLAPGKLLIKPTHPPDCGGPNGKKGFFTYYDGMRGEYNLPSMFHGWDVFVSVKPRFDPALAPFKIDDVAVANVLMLDERRLCVDASETEAIAQFERWGFETVRVPFKNAMMLGGGFHCFTVDIRRRGELTSYF